MNAVRKNKLIKIVVISAVISIAMLLILYALRQNISLFYTPTQLITRPPDAKRLVRMGGMVVRNSVHRQGLWVTFKLTDYKQTITVTYQGILPDLFREEQGIVTLGYFVNNHFKAQQVLAKHDANYMPAELKGLKIHKL